jgi:hypothetical protein
LRRAVGTTAARFRGPLQIENKQRGRPAYVYEHMSNVSSDIQLAGGVLFVVGTGILYGDTTGLLITNVVLYLVGALLYQLAMTVKLVSDILRISVVTKEASRCKRTKWWISIWSVLQFYTGSRAPGPRPARGACSGSGCPSGQALRSAKSLLHRRCLLPLRGPRHAHRLQAPSSLPRARRCTAPSTTPSCSWPVRLLRHAPALVALPGPR